MLPSALSSCDSAPVCSLLALIKGAITSAERRRAAEVVAINIAAAAEVKGVVVILV